MATPIKEWSKLEVRAVVRFLFSKGTKPSEIHKQIPETYGEGAMSRSRVYQWCTWFGEGRTSLGDEPKSGRPKTSTNEEKTTRVDELIRCDRRMKIREIALKLEIPKRTVHEIVHDTLGYRKMSARWVPKMLTEDHKLQRVEISQRLLQRCQQDNASPQNYFMLSPHFLVWRKSRPGGDFQANNNLFDNLITGDETWVHLNTPETKRDSMTWKHPSSPVTKKFKMQRSAAKVMATVFWDAKGVILLDILPQGQCINAARYCSTLDRLKKAIRRKRPGLLRRGVVLQHDNATPHSANLTQQWLQRYGWEIVPHPAHSPDLALSDFHLFGPLKRHLGSMAFETEDELRNWFDNLDVDFFRVGINSLLSRWQKCIDLHGDYVEK
ncbi:histone-lysine N-methyltransferase SETMAR [Plakobranchus ocellatus]|uniref:Histone-lysine N-methyltransferase SETMAR n=1 Tax=Plakobranchus ocellatus TaxID=259542 RepID=A0AAV4DWH8_9GAST|nr:histone-lysine N-methyltransferase SETMAR [Plakobranchus ocellatus]